MQSDDIKSAVEFTQCLVRIPSVLGNEAEVAKVVAGRMNELHFDRVESDAARNVVGMIQGLAGGPMLLFDGHMDTL